MEKELEKVEIIENKVEYGQPKFWHKIMSNLVDILVFALLAMIIFSISNSIITKSKSYRNISNRCDEIRLESSLFYINVDDELEFVTEYIDDFVDYPTFASKVDSFLLPIIETNFPNFLRESCSKEIENEYFSSLNNFKKEVQNESGQPLFVLNGDQYIRNPSLEEATNNKLYYEVYCAFLNETAQGFLTTYHEEYNSLTLKMSKIFILAEIPLVLLVSFLITYLVPPLIFKRGRKTFGKLLYKISCMDERLLSPSINRFLLRTLIVFIEFAVSIFTYGIPLLLSFSLMAFSKYHQGFPDYVLKIIEIDSSKNKVYMSYDEAKILQLPNSKKPIDFKSKSY